MDGFNSNKSKIMKKSQIIVEDKMTRHTSNHLAVWNHWIELLTTEMKTTSVFTQYHPLNLFLLIVLYWSSKFCPLK